MTIHWPQMLWLAMALIKLGSDFANHGKVRKPSAENGWASLIAFLLTLSILYLGGFFAGATP